MAAIWWQAKAEMSQMCDRHPKALPGNSLELRAAHDLRKGALTTPAGTQDKALTRRLKRVTMPAREAGLSTSVRSVKTGYCPLTGMVFQASMALARQLYQICDMWLLLEPWWCAHGVTPPFCRLCLTRKNSGGT